MNKSILIIDTPFGCEDCELCIDDYFCLRLGEVDESVENGTKDLRCPLRPIPYKREAIGILNDYERGKILGYNVCIDEILGENE